MKFSKYNLYVPKYPYENSTLIYNTLSKASVVVNDELKGVIEDTKGRNLSSDGVDSEDRTLMEELKSIGIIVDDHIDEGFNLNYWFNRTRFSSLVWNGVIVPSTDCDLGCTYCFQGMNKPTHYMNRRMQEDVVKWFMRKVDKDRPKQVFWIFFGGEPLLNIPCLDYTTAEMARQCSERGVIFQFSIVTNGTNLMPEKVKQWTANGLVSVQVTVDGTPDTHNIRRPFISGGKSYDRIFQNMKDCAGLTRMILRINLDRQNIPDIPQFLESLKNEGLAGKLDIFYGLLLDGNTYLEHQVQYKTKDKEGAKGVLWLRQEAMNRGFNVTEILEGGPCMAKSEFSVLIDPKGRIYKCTGHVGIDEIAFGDMGECSTTQARCSTGDAVPDQFAIGTIYDDHDQLEVFQQKYAQHVGMQLVDDCLDCAFGPVCLGGCPYKALTRYGDFKKMVCEKPFYYTVYKDVLKQMYSESHIQEKLREDDQLAALGTNSGLSCAIDHKVEEQISKRSVRAKGISC